MRTGLISPSRAWHPLLLLLPTLLVLGVFIVYPLFLAGYRSLFAWDLLTPPSFVGLANYRALAHSGELLRIAGRTLAFSTVVVLFASVLGLALAVLLNREGRLFAFVRGAIFSAYVVSWVAVALLWLWLLDGQGGLVSRLFITAGFAPRDWLGDPDIVLFTLAGVTVWKITGYAMVVFLAGLQDMPRSLLEAAALDGASPAQTFTRIVWPVLRPTAAFVGTTSLIASFQAFDVVRVMTQGGPVRASTIFVYAIYEEVFMNLRVGRASALVVVFFGLLVLLTGLQLWAWRAASRGRVAS
ncbi:MAG: sugar ABC transporter permease [Myxococcales bacterium]|nr:sugar ABC transporter permease [Myxococcales bacterium]